MIVSTIRTRASIALLAFGMLLLFTVTALALAKSPAKTSAKAPTKSIAISFDDIPRTEGAFFTPDVRTAKLITGLKKAKVKQAGFFLNPASLLKSEGLGGQARITDYVKAGHIIANHSNAHPALTAVTAEAYLADIDDAETWLKGRTGYRPWFRYPYLNEGRSDAAKRDAVRAGLAARGLRNAYVTVDAYDWYMEDLAVKAKAAGKTMDIAALREFYVRHHVNAANFNEALLRKTIGGDAPRTPAHVMLLHETDIAALFIADLLAALRKDGWTIITMDEAYRDPIGMGAPPKVPSAQGTLTEALAWEKGLPAPRWYAFLDEEKMAQEFRTLVLKETQ